MRAIFPLNSFDLKWWVIDMRLNKNMLTGLLLMIPVTIFGQSNYPVDSKVVAQIREEGFQRSEIASTLSYMTDVIGHI